MNRFHSPRPRRCEGASLTLGSGNNQSFPKPYQAAILAVVQQIPPGWVLSYGAVAKRAGLPRYARQVAVALRESQDQTLPWWRVVNSQGGVSPRGLDGCDDLQRVLLHAEGVVFDQRGRIDLRIFAWPG